MKGKGKGKEGNEREKGRKGDGGIKGKEGKEREKGKGKENVLTVTKFFMTLDCATESVAQVKISNKFYWLSIIFYSTKVNGKSSWLPQ